MFDPEFLKYLASMGTGGSIAGLIFMFYRKDAQANIDQWKGQSEALLDVVKSNTAAITSNTELVRALTHRLDRMDDR